MTSPELWRDDWWRLAVHEAAHGVTAAYYGVPIREVLIDRELGKGITVTRTGQSPRIEAAISLAGIAAVPSPLGTDLANALEFISVAEIDETIRQVRSEVLLPYWHIVTTVAVELHQAGSLPGERVVELLRSSPARPPKPARSAVTWMPYDPS